MSTSLERLAETARRELELLDYPRRDWLTARRTSAGEPIFDVLIVGAGQGGLATAFGLLRERVKNLVLIDQNPLDHAGPWRTFARMRTLRTPKHVTGPDLGVPSLSPRAYFEAEHGAGSWERLGLLPKETWAAYLAWYRRTLEIPVVPETRVGALEWNARERAWAVPCESARGRELRHARRVVLATGIEGSGAWQIPAFVRDALPERLYAHTRADIDFGALAGRRVAVLGAGASAFDNAAVALEAGAREVHLFFRRPSLVRVNAYRWAESAGFLKHHADLPDETKWRFIVQILRMGQLPPADTLERARQHPGFHLHPASTLSALRAEGELVRFATEHGTFEVDFLIVGTGFVTDLGLRPELEHVEPFIARWADRFTPPPNDRNEELSRHPYLGPHFEFTERDPGTAPYLRYLFNYTFGGLLSLGFGGASISGMKYSNQRLVSGLTRSLYLEDAPEHLQSLIDFAEAEF
jgi:cation diffusion facilitator CzcD-associated flavoprotein CzcO